MNKIALPKNVEFKKGDEPNSAKIIIGPCFPGYGITLGNSIRRVLLSSLPGAAPVGVKIKGVDHEFMTLPHLKEDILEFILNLKQLRLKVFSDEPVKLTLKIHGEKEITAGDIDKNPEVEIANKDLVLGHITDMSGSLEAEITIKKGMGYEMVESRIDTAKEIGQIEMDSVFSPVLAVAVNVESARVGKMTNWDNLILDLKTDGTITPEEAFDESVKILIEQFSALSPKAASELEKEELEKEAEEKKNKEEEKEDVGEDKKEDEENDDEPKKRGRPKKS